MDRHLEIPAITELSAFDFIVTWNQLPETSAVARARLTFGTPQVFDFRTVSGTRLVLGNVAAGTSAEMLHHLVRQVLLRRGIETPTDAQEQTLADGTVLLVVALAG